ncbi:MAG: hypothetical protein ACU841_09315 [Gammaproteobacteria bacterium]
MITLNKRFLAVIGCVVAAVAAGLLTEVLLSRQSGSYFGHTQSGHVAGWTGLAAILTVFVYSVKKRCDRKSGRPDKWFRVHQMAGIVGPLLILIHAGPHFHALVPILALAAMLIVVASGLIGVMVHRKAIGLLRSTRKALSAQGLAKEQIEDRLYQLASAEESFRIWQLIHVPMAILFLVLTIIHVLGALYFGGL